MSGAAGTCLASAAGTRCWDARSPTPRGSKARPAPSGAAVTGYEIHLGQTTGPDCARAWLSVDGRPEGAASPDGRVRGCYLHGLFASDGFRGHFLRELGATPALRHDESVDAALDALARHVETHLDIDLLLTLAEPPTLCLR